jgi:hypothetical protein
MVVGCGKTRNESIKSVKEAILSYLDSIEEGMSIERVQKKNMTNWT